jgi:hypothetical protein
LSWKTSAEINTDRFEVERSLNGNDFVYTGRVAASGNSTSLQAYEFVDRGIIKNAGSVLFYRVKMLDQDGRFTYSNVLPVHIKNKTGNAVVYPNPVKESATIVMVSESRQILTYTLLDYSGKSLAKNVVTLQEGVNSFSLDTQNLPAGPYLLKMITGSQEQQLKIIKQ